MLARRHANRFRYHCKTASISQVITDTRLASPVGLANPRKAIRINRPVVGAQAQLHKAAHAAAI